MENGQYNEGWKYIHTMPRYLGQAAKDLKAKKIITVHHSKYALARHRWDEPLENEIKAGKRRFVESVCSGNRSGDRFESIRKRSSRIN